MQATLDDVLAELQVHTIAYGTHSQQLTDIFESMDNVIFWLMVGCTGIGFIAGFILCRITLAAKHGRTSV